MAVSLLNYVFDDSGNAVSGATVTPIGRTGGTGTATTTDSTGKWEFDDLADDTYDIKIEYGGKTRWQMGDVEFQIGGFVNESGSLPINDDSITSGKIADDAVLTANLADGSVTAAKLASSAVTSTKIGGSAVGTAAIASAAVTNAKLAANAVGTSNIQDGSITSAKLADGVGGGSGTTLEANSVSSIHIVSGAVDTSELATGAVTNSKLASNAVSSSKIASNAINSEHYVSGSIDEEHLSVLLQNKFDDISDAVINRGGVRGVRVAMSGNLSSSGNLSGDIGFQIAGDLGAGVYVWGGAGWFRIA